MVQLNKPHTFTWVICRDVDGPRDFIQGEVSQKEKNKWGTLMHTSGIQKNSTDDPICNAEIEKGMQRANECIQRGKPERNWETGIYIHY